VKITAFCEHCGGPFERLASSKRLYCSASCRRAAPMAVPSPTLDLRQGICATGALPARYWTSGDRVAREAARLACSTCPVLAACASWSLSLPGTDAAIYGAMTVRERVAHKREAARLSKAPPGMARRNAAKTHCDHGHPLRHERWGRLVKTAGESGQVADISVCPHWESALEASVVPPCGHRGYGPGSRRGSPREDMAERMRRFDAGFAAWASSRMERRLARRTPLASDRTGMMTSQAMTAPPAVSTSGGVGSSRVSVKRCYSPSTISSATSAGWAFAACFRAATSARDLSLVAVGRSAPSSGWLHW
jgi:hypothetical protein